MTRENEDVKINEEKKETKHSKRKEKGKDEFIAKSEYDKMQEQFTKALNTAAYYENQGKYYKGEYEKSLKYRSQALAESLLPVLDGFQLAFKMEPANKEAANYKVGFEFVHKMLLDSLASEGLSIITPKVGDKFNSQSEQAVETIEIEDETKDQVIAESLLNGYMLKDRLIRPASVKLFKLKESNVEVNQKVEESVVKNDDTISKEAKN